MKTFGKIIGITLLIIGAFLLYGLSIYIGWNKFLADVFTLSHLTYIESLKVSFGLLFIISPLYTRISSKK